MEMTNKAVYNAKVLGKMKEILEKSDEAFKCGVMNVPDTIKNNEAMLEILKTIERKIGEMKDVEDGKTQLNDIDIEDFAYDYRCFLYLLTGLLSYEYTSSRVRFAEDYDRPLGAIIYWFIPDEDHLADGDDGLVHYISGLRR